MDAVIVGDRYLVSLFRLIGIEAIETVDESSAITKIQELIESGNCKLLFMSERTASKLKELREKLIGERRLYPIFVIVPDFEGTLGERKKELQELMNKSMGIKLKAGD